MSLRLCIGLIGFAMGCLPVLAEGQPADRPDPPRDVRPSDVLEWRNVGPNRGGRSIAVAGHADRPHTYYFGATGGGLWKTTDGGTTWAPTTDGQLGSSSVGAVAVAPSDPNVIYIGMGEVQLRNNVIPGDGVYRSTDGGETWTHLGLEETQAIGRVRVHPKNPDRVYVAALGHPFGENEQRGVFRSTDGGETWEKVLYQDTKTGAVDLALDPTNPDVLYASFWEVYRKPWKLWSGGDGSALYKSTDGGDTWTELSDNDGFAEGVLGKIGVSVSRANPDRLYAVVEAEDGGLYRSDDGGRTWTRVNASRDLWQRSFYFNRVVAGPQDASTVYVLNYHLLKSTDGGASFERIPGRHVDHHDLWIDPTNPERMVGGNDGGGSVSVNGGKTWSDQNFPTAQLYRVSTTEDVPYHVCGPQQDNSTVCVPSEHGDEAMAPPGWFLSEPQGTYFYDVGGGENSDVAPHPATPSVFYAGGTNNLTRFDRRTNQARGRHPYPRVVMGEPAEAMPERWNWVFPIVFSPADTSTLYAGSQHLWRTTNRGRRWQKISPDLTRADPKTLGPTGGPIVKDQDGPEVYATLVTIAPSPHDAGTIWTGSDDGLIHLTQDGGETWTDVTPPDLAPYTTVSRIDASPHAPGTAYVAAHRYELDDRAPYLWKTTDHGETWTRIDDGLPEDNFVRVVRVDPEREGLLYAGTEHGVYVSFKAGANWQSLSLNLPDTPVYDLAVEGRDLVAATHGRSFYVLDDLAPLRQWTRAVDRKPFYLYEPADAVRRTVPAVLDYVLHEPADSVRLQVLDDDGELVRTLDGASAEPGGHRVTWDLRYPGATVFENMILESQSPAVGPWAPPGSYQVRLVVDGRSVTRPLAVRMDPRLDDVTRADLREQFELARQIRDATSAANEAVVLIRTLRTQIQNRRARVDDGLPVAEQILDSLAAVERSLYQVKNESPKDKIAYPIKLNDRLAGQRAHL
jgi:photosystem II stability/assembly factor-like uncharacterized protein